MNMDCNQTKKLIQEYVDNELTPDEQKAVETHIQKCDSCRREVLKTEKLSGLFRNGDIEEDVPPMLVTSTWQAIEEAHRNRSIFDFLFTRKGLSYSMAMYALGLVVIITGYFFLPVGMDSRYRDHNLEGTKISRTVMQENGAFTTFDYDY
ncbi:MAG: zf-HC2 domain-containing protein [Candidatus Eremiobacteraeota bacterium]|nr:zf-HC2 domain-containing protein [Candidatus Eremiobacteraeota bacterium]